MNRAELAALLNGREYTGEITAEEEAQAKADGLLVIFGASDDLVEFRGAFNDEVGAFNGTKVLVHPESVLPKWEEVSGFDEATMQRYFDQKKNAHPVEAKWDVEGYSWVISTTLPHSVFNIMEDGETYCRGIVIDTKDMVTAQ